MAEEGELRKALRESWDAKKFGELVWVENRSGAIGGTVGAPDVFVPLGARGYCPVELKWWEVYVNGDVKIMVRPSQVRFHTLAMQAGQRTALLARLSTGVCVVVPGARCIMETEGVWLRTTELIDLRKNLLDPTFWRDRL
jgi:hypothetical protein